MNIRNVLLILTIVLLPLEGTILSLPLVFALSLLSYTLFSDESTLIVVFVAGFVLDILRIIPPGSTLIAMALSFLIIYFWRRLFETRDLRVALGIIFIFSFVYAKFFDYSVNVLVYFSTFLFSAAVISYFTKRKVLW
jgi:hypothetical protein